MNSTSTTPDLSIMFGKMFKELNKIGQANAHQATIIKSLNEQLKQFQSFINGGENTTDTINVVNNHSLIINNKEIKTVKVNDCVYFTPQFAQYLEGNTTDIVFGNINMEEKCEDNILAQDTKVAEKQVEPVAEKQVDTEKQVEPVVEKQVDAEKQVESVSDTQVVAELKQINNEIIIEAEQITEETEKAEPFYDDFRVVEKQQKSKKQFEKKLKTLKPIVRDDGLSSLIGKCKKLKLGRTQEVIPICRAIGFSPEQLIGMIGVLADRLSLFTVVPDAQNDIILDNTKKAIFALQYMSGLIDIELADKLMLQSYEDCDEINLSLKQMLHQLYMVEDIAKLIIEVFINDPNDLINRFQSQILLPLDIITEDEIVDYGIRSDTYARYSSLL